MLSNMRLLQMATRQMAEDGVQIGNRNLGWPGDTGGTFTNWARQLVTDYFSTNDMCKLLSAPGKLVKPWNIPESMSEGALLVYAVRANTPENTVFLTSANFTNTPTGGAALNKKARPFGNDGFVVMRKAGDGNILTKKQTGQANLIGSYTPLLQ